MNMPVETPASTALVSCDGLGGYDWSDQAKEGNFMHPKPNLSFPDLEEIVNEPIVSEPTLKKPVDETSEAKASADKPKVGNPQMDLQDKGVIDSGCSRHMTGNMSYLTDYEEIDRGYVAFGGNPKRMIYYTSSIKQFWTIAKAQTINGETQLHVKVDGKKVIITESTIRRDLKFGEEKGVNCLSNDVIFEQLALIRKKIFKNMKRVGKGFSGRDTPLFQTMMTKRKVTEVPQPSDPTENVADEAVNEEMDDSLVRATTTATSLDTEQDRCGGPKCKETIADATAQTRDDSLKLDELIELCTKLQQRVLDLETTKTTQALEINSLKTRVKKLEKKHKSRIHKLKRLYKVGLSARVESSDDNESLGEEDASKQERISALEALKTSKPKIRGIVIREHKEPSETRSTTTISSKKSQDKGKAKMIEEPMKPKKKDQILLDEEVAKKLQDEINEEERLAGERAQQELEEKATLFMQLLEKRRKFFAVKRAEEKMNRLPTRAQQRSIMCTYLKNMEGWKPNTLKNKSFTNIQELFDKAMKRVNTFVDYRTELVEESSKKSKAEVIEGSSKRAGTKLEQKNVKKQKIDDDKETTELKQLVKIILDEEGVAINAIL
nr:hypothetical protein [Tanacetum cinerariifolium]